MKRVFSPSAKTHYYIVVDDAERQQLLRDGVTDPIFTHDHLKIIKTILKNFPGSKVTGIEKYVPSVYKDGLSSLHSGEAGGSRNGEERCGDSDG
jgi:hypothetical protein